MKRLQKLSHYSEFFQGLVLLREVGFEFGHLSYVVVLSSLLYFSGAETYEKIIDKNEHLNESQFRKIINVVEPFIQSVSTYSLLQLALSDNTQLDEKQNYSLDWILLAFDFAIFLKATSNYKNGYTYCLSSVLSMISMSAIGKCAKRTQNVCHGLLGTMNLFRCFSNRPIIKAIIKTNEYKNKL